MYGKYSAVRGYEKSPLTQQYTRTYGGTLGGAIVKDKLFYFVSAEAKKESYPSSIYPGYTTSYLTSDQAKQIADAYYNMTGFQENYAQRNIDNKSFGLLARIDWNINQNTNWPYAISTITLTMTTMELVQPAICLKTVVTA